GRAGVNPWPCGRGPGVVAVAVTMQLPVAGMDGVEPTGHEGVDRLVGRGGIAGQQGQDVLAVDGSIVGDGDAGGLEGGREEVDGASEFVVDVAGGNATGPSRQERD